MTKFTVPLQPGLLIQVTELLTPTVVEYLPPYFAHINSISDAKKWLHKMLSESRLFVVKHTHTSSIIGFVFIFVEHDTEAHIGYLLGEAHWKKGYATELLEGLIDFVTKEKRWVKLIAGVAPSNEMSSKLLLKLGFVEQPNGNKQMAFYEYQLSQS